MSYDELGVRMAEDTAIERYELEREKLGCPVCGTRKEAVQVVCNDCWSKVPAEVRLELFKANSRRRSAMPKAGTEFSAAKLKIATASHDSAQRAVIAAAEKGGG